MVAEFLSCFGPDKNDARLYLPGSTSQLPTGVSFPTTTDDSAAPPQGDRWMKILDTASDLALQGIYDVTAKSFCWFVQRGARVRGTLTAGQTSQYLTVRVDTDTIFSIEWVRVSDSTFNWRLTRGGGRTLVATGTTAFSTDTTYTLRLQLDGTNATLWVDGAQEIRVAYTRKFNKDAVIGRETPSSGQQHYYSRLLLCHSDSESDRPDTDVEIGTLTEDGDWATEQGYGDDSNCDPGQTGAVAADIALSSDVVVTSSFWCEHASEADSQMVELTTFTFTVGKDILGAMQRCTGGANVGAKTVTTQGRIHDGTSAIEKTMHNIPGVIHAPQIAPAFPLAPDGGTWTQADVDGLKGGVSSDSGNGANDEWSALIFELVAVSADPPGRTQRSTLVKAGPRYRAKARRAA